MINAVQRASPMLSLLLLFTLLAGSVLSANPTDPWISARKAKATQYHTQDPTSGAYQYGYTGPHHAKSESSFNGVTRGGYSYVDANGLMQTVSYTADAENGFRVHASNLPSRNSLNPVQDTPEVALAKKRHLDQVRKAESLSWQQQQDQPLPPYRSQQQSPRSRNPYLLTSEEARGIPAPRPSNALDGGKGNDDGDADVESVEAEHLGYLGPQRRGFSASSASIHHAYVQVPAVFAMPLPLVHTSMRHTQDTLGQYEYSYTGDTSAKTESRTLDGTTRGAYSYIDANGLLQQVHYIADRDGFRVLATNLPQA